MKSDADYFSLANGLNYVTGGWTEGVVGALNDAFLGNTVSDVIGGLQGDTGSYRNIALDKGVVPKGASLAASVFPDLASTTTGIRRDCNATSGSAPVGTWDALVNTMIDGPFLKSPDGRVSGYYTPEAQMGAFDSTYTRSGGVVDITVTNPISLNSAALHRTAPLGIPNPTSAPFGTVKKAVTLFIYGY